MEQLTLQTENQNALIPEVKILGKADIPAMLALQDKVHSDDLIAKDALSLSRHFNDGNSAIGIEHNGKLVAQLTIKAENGPIGTGTIGFFMSDPDYRGQGYAGQLLSVATAHMKDSGYSVAQARVKQDNGTQAWKHFAKQGFDLVAQGESPDQAGRQVYILQKQLEKAIAILPQNDMAAAPVGLAL